MTSKRAGLDGLSKRSKTGSDCTVTLFVRHSASIPPKWGGGWLVICIAWEIGEFQKRHTGV